MVQYDLKYLRSKTKERTQHFCDVEFCVDRRLEISVFDNAVVDPRHGVWNENKEFCRASYKHNCRAIDDIVQNGLPIDEKEIESCEEDVLYIGMFMPPWGHYFTDNIKHLWPLVAEKCSNDKFHDMPVVFIFEQTNIPDNFYQMLELIGIERQRLRRISKPTRFNSVVVPDQCFFYDPEHDFELRCTKEYYNLIDRLTSKIEPKKGYEKVFFTTSSFAGRAGNYGVYEIDKVFEKLGYAIISPEKMNFVEMVSLLKGCKYFAATEGSAGHNSLFLEKGTECVFLRRVDAVNIYQHMINYVRELNVTLIDAHFSFLLYYKPIPWNGPFFLYCSKQLRKWSGVWRPFPLGQFVRYVRDYGKKWIKARLFK